MRLHARDVQELSQVTDAIHDWWMNIEDMQHDPVKNVLTIPIGPSSQRTTAHLVIRNVVEVHMEDREHVGCYDINTIEYDDKAARVRITTGIPLVLTIAVQGLDVELVQRA